MSLKIKAMLASFIVAGGTGTVGSTSAQSYPDKPIRLIVPFPSGSGPDANARVLAAGLSRTLGQQLLIDNRPGASGIIGTQLAEIGRAHV